MEIEHREGVAVPEIVGRQRDSLLQPVLSLRVAFAVGGADGGYVIAGGVVVGILPYLFAEKGEGFLVVTLLIILQCIYVFCGLGVEAGRRGE